MNIIMNVLFSITVLFGNLQAFQHVSFGTILGMSDEKLLAVHKTALSGRRSHNGMEISDYKDTKIISFSDVFCVDRDVSGLVSIIDEFPDKEFIFTGYGYGANFAATVAYEAEKMLFNKDKEVNSTYYREGLRPNKIKLVAFSAEGMIGGFNPIENYNMIHFRRYFDRIDPSRSNIYEANLPLIMDLSSRFSLNEFLWKFIPALSASIFISYKFGFKKWPLFLLSAIGSYISSVWEKPETFSEDDLKTLYDSIKGRDSELYDEDVGRFGWFLWCPVRW